MNDLRAKVKFLPLGERESYTSLAQVAVDPNNIEPEVRDGQMEKIARSIVTARKNNRSVILAHGAHLVKNGLGILVRRMIEEDLITHVATNGASCVHEWEFAYHGMSEERVSEYLPQGKFGCWQETALFHHLALYVGATFGLGYGNAIGRLISTGELRIPSEEMLERTIQNEEDGSIRYAADTLKSTLKEWEKYEIRPGTSVVEHPFSSCSIQAAAYEHDIPSTVHPMFGHDIVYMHPLANGGIIGICAEKDFDSFVKSVYDLEGGVFLNVGSAVMGPQVFEKALSVARNVAHQEGKKIEDFSIVVNDLQPRKWDWGMGEPPKNHPEYYDRIMKSFSRARPSHFSFKADSNRNFMCDLYASIKFLEAN